MKKLRLLWLGILALVLVTAACSPPPELRDNSLLHDTSLITGTPCSAPCWQNITPGQTKWSDALTVVQDNSTMDDPTLQNDPNGSAVVAEWQEKGGQSCCQMFSKDGSTVSIILLRTAPTMTLGQVIDKYGAPPYLLGSTFTDDQAIMNLVYPDIPMVVYGFVAGAANGRLSASSEIVAVMYLTQEDMDLLLKTSNLHEWAGYQPYAFYDQRAFDVTPSVTLTPTPGQ
jgi:hypothetical protein